MGDRYGYRPVPSMITAQDYDIILAHMTNDNDKQLMSIWYQIDANVVPPVVVFVLFVNKGVCWCIFCDLYIR